MPVQSKNISLGNTDTLLERFLSAMSVETQVQQKARFASVAANFEFGLFVPLREVERLFDEATQKGFTAWANVDATSAFLYGAGIVGQEEFTPIMTWIRNAATPSQKINVGIHNIGEPMQHIVVQV
jgi:hypothetical protein